MDLKRNKGSVFDYPKVFRGKQEGKSRERKNHENKLKDLSEEEKIFSNIKENYFKRNSDKRSESNKYSNSVNLSYCKPFGCFNFPKIKFMLFIILSYEFWHSSSYSWHLSPILDIHH